MLPGRGPLGRRAGPGVGPPARGALGRGVCDGLVPSPPRASVGLSFSGRSALGVLGRAAGLAGLEDAAGLGAPGLTAAGRGAGAAPGLGPGVDGVGAVGAGATGAAGLVGAAEAAGAAGVAVTPGVGPVAGAGAAGWVVVGAGAVEAGAGRAVSGLTSVSGLTPRVSRIFRTTGDSNVEDGPRTYSPISLSLFSSSLLVIPTSFAISWTRGLATTLL